MFAQLFGSIFGSLLIVSTTRVSAPASMRVCVKSDSVRDCCVSKAVNQQTTSQIISPAQPAATDHVCQASCSAPEVQRPPHTFCASVHGSYTLLKGQSSSPKCAALQAGLIPGSSIGMGDKGTGCFAPGEGVTKGKLKHVLLHTFCCLLQHESQLSVISKCAQSL
jgi:hypothetical protein